MSEIPVSDVTVSIILTESTASLLNLDIPHLEEIAADNSCYNLCRIKAIENKNEIQEKCPEVKKQRSLRSTIWNSVNNYLDTDSDRTYPEIAYLSRHTTNSASSIDIIDDLSASNVSLVSKKSSVILDEVKLYMRPLVAIKTVAHQNKLKVEGNNILVSILDSDLTITGSGWVNMCRICHGGASIGNLLAPCRCRGSVALAHLACLERWLKESSSSRCELCQHHYKIVRQPKYSVPRSIFVFLRHPGDHLKELLLDLMAFIVYTPSAIGSTYMLMLLCESIAKNNLRTDRNVSSHVMAFAAIFGMAAIDFTYSSWLIVTLQKHAEAWRAWYRSNCDFKLILPAWKQKKINGDVRK